MQFPFVMVLYMTTTLVECQAISQNILCAEEILKNQWVGAGMGRRLQFTPLNAAYEKLP